MKKYNQIIFILILLFASIDAFSELIKSNLKVKFNNKNWFPLTLEEMEKASVDKALSEITKMGVFQLGKKNSPNHQVKSLVFIEVSLVEAASSIKVTIRISTPNKPEIYATASGSILDKKYQGIFKAFENVGMLAGKKASSQISNHYIVFKKEEQKEGRKETTASHPWIRSLKKAQELKEKLKFRESQNVLKKLLKRVKENKEWKEAVFKELYFDLPNFEADYLVSSASENAHSTSYTVQTNQAKEIYRQIIKKNSSYPLRIQKTQSKLDALSSQGRYVDLSKKSVVKVKFSEASMRYLQMESMYGGRRSKMLDKKLNGRTKVQYILEEVYPDSIVSVIEFSKDSGDITYRIQSKYGAGNHKVSGNLLKRHKINEIQITME